MPLRPLAPETCAEKPGLAAVLDEPITQLLIERDGTDRNEILALLHRAHHNRSRDETAAGECGSR